LNLFAYTIVPIHQIATDPNSLDQNGFSVT